MKTKCFVLLVSIISIVANAQEKMDCSDSEKQFGKMLFERDFVKANEEWSSFKKNCLNASEHSFRLAAELWQYNIDVAPDADKEKPVRELLNVYDSYEVTFPNNHNGNSVRKAMALYDNKVGTNAEIFTLLDRAFTLQKSDFNNPKALNVYFQLFYSKFTEGKSSISEDKLIEKYIDIASLCEVNAVKFADKKEEYRTLASSAKALVFDLLTCDRLTSFAQKNFESNKNNPDWLLAMTMVMADKCISKPFFETIALQLHQVAPSSKSAFYLGNYYNNALQLTKAVSFFEQSVALSTSNDEKATTSYTIASILVNTDKAKAHENLLVAIANQPKNGKYFIFLSNLYANATECATTDKERKALYQLAINTLQKAAQLEPKYSQTAANITKGFLKNRGDIAELKGKTVKIDCWINESVTF